MIRPCKQDKGEKHRFGASDQLSTYVLTHTHNSNNIYNDYYAAILINGFGDPENRAVGFAWSQKASQQKK